MSERARKSLVPGLFRPAVHPPPVGDDERKRAQEAPTLPPPPDDEAKREVDLLSQELRKPGFERTSDLRPATPRTTSSRPAPEAKRPSRPSRASRPSSSLPARPPSGIVVDEVTANRKRDTRFDDD